MQEAGNGTPAGARKRGPGPLLATAGWMAATLYVVALLCGFVLPERRADPSMVFWFAVLVLAALAPLIAAARVLQALWRGGEGAMITACLVPAAGLSAVIAWAGLGTTWHFFALFPIGLGVACCGALAFLDEWKGPQEADGGARRSRDTLLWTGTLACALLLLSFPLGAHLQGIEVERAKRWIEGVGAEVLAADGPGKPPAGVTPAILEKAGPPPRLLRGGRSYTCTGSGSTLQFEFRDPGEFFPGGWIYTPATRAWRQWSF